jgi:hypothetical protein
MRQASEGPEVALALANIPVQQGAQTFETYEVDDVARNDAGGPMFNLFGVRCLAWRKVWLPKISSHLSPGVNA